MDGPLAPFAPRRAADVAVIGAGVIGLSTAYALRRRGVSVTVYERGVPGAGQSGGESRILRHTHADPRLIAFTRDGIAAWREWERELETELLVADGVVSIGPQVERRLPALEAAGIAARLLDASELRARLPLLADHAGPALLDEGGGVIRARATIAALRARLSEQLVFDEVISVRPLGDDTVQVRAGGVVAEYGRAVVCAGRGTAALARGAELELPIRHQAHVRLGFAVRAPAPARLSCLLDGSGAFGEAGAYADPLPGNGVYAVGLDETPARADGALLEPDGLAELAARTRAYVARALPGLDSLPVDVRHCAVTTLPAGHDAIAVWQAGPCAFLAGNNMFKHAPALGRALADGAVGDDDLAWLSPEARFGAQEAGAEASRM